MTKADKRRYKTILKEELFFGDIENMSAKDIYHLKEYSDNKTERDTKNRKRLLYVGVIYIITAILSAVDTLLKFDSYSIIAYLFIISTIALMIMSWLTIHNTSYRSSTLNMVIGTMSPKRQAELLEYEKSYKKIANREENIDSILNS